MILICVQLLFATKKVLIENILKSKIKYQKVSEYDQEIPQPHTVDQPTAPDREPIKCKVYTSS